MTHKMSFVFILLLGYLTFKAAALRNCTPEDFHYEYTECDSESGRWKVAIPNTLGACVGNTPNPVRGKECAFTCKAGQYLDIAGQQECKPCPPGTYSLGGGLRFDDWDTLPTGFAVHSESFAGSRFYLKALAGARLLADPNCTNAGWVPKGSYIASLAGGCSASLSYSVNLVKPGEVKFTYQHTDEDAIFQYTVQNNECQTVSDQDSSRWPSVTGEGKWKTITVSLKSGLNLLHWKTMGVSNDETSIKKPILIRKIEISGVAYTSECTKCKSGSYSNNTEGAAVCTPCPANFKSERGAKICSPCPSYQYSGVGSTKCIGRPPCSRKDYFEYNSACDVNNETQVMYKWIEPKVCVDGQKSVPLPASGLKKPCPPCNPGMEFNNGTCRFCTAGEFSDGINPCSRCTATTAPVRELVYKWWNSLPDEANITSACLSLADRGCSRKEGWATGLEYIYSGKGHADDAYLVLSLTVGGFAGREDPRRDKSNPVGNISFVFELECTADCTFFFMMQTQSSGTTVIEDWSGNQRKQQYTYALTTTEAVTFTWAFQKLDSEVVATDGRGERYRLVNDAAKIYSINVTNILQGGASRCRLCPQGANREGCIPCPVGYYIDPNTTRCMSCPAHTVVHGNNPWGIDSCKPCGPGLTAHNNIKCVSDGHYTSPDGKHYDFTPLAGLQSTTGTPLFTASGTQYFHYFNISLFGNHDGFPLTQCHDNISYYDEIASEVVTSVICRVTLIPPRPGDAAGSMAAQPVSLGDVLVNITTDGKSLNMEKRMKDNGFPTEGSEMDVHFTYTSEVPTSVCRTGRSTIITVRCDIAEKGAGKIKLPPSCPDGTCDGCNFHFLWFSRTGCPSCKAEDYEVVKGECQRGMQEIHYLPPKDCIEINVMKKTERPCSILPFWLEIVVSICVGIGIMLIILLLYCWKRNRKLEYKYSKLQENKEGREGELPGADSCGLDEEEDDEHYDAVAFKESKGKQLFKKIKFMAKKDADNPFESIQLTNKDNLLT